MRLIIVREDKAVIKDGVGYYVDNLDWLDTKINAVCYPEGVFNQKIIETAFLVGYEKQYSSIPGFYCIKSSKNVINRSLVQFSELKEFKAILKGGDHLLYYWYKFKHYKK